MMDDPREEFLRDISWMRLIRNSIKIASEIRRFHVIRSCNVRLFKEIGTFRLSPYLINRRTFEILISGRGFLESWTPYYGLRETLDRRGFLYITSERGIREICKGIYDSVAYGLRISEEEEPRYRRFESILNPYRAQIREGNLWFSVLVSKGIGMKGVQIFSLAPKWALELKVTRGCTINLAGPLNLEHYMRLTKIFSFSSINPGRKELD